MWPDAGCATPGLLGAGPHHGDHCRDGTEEEVGVHRAGTTALGALGSFLEVALELLCEIPASIGPAHQRETIHRAGYWIVDA